MTPRKSHDQRREEIAQTALELAGERGVGGVTTQAIADRMGVSQATVFRHFASRDEIFREAIAHVTRSVFQALGPIFEDRATPAAERLERLVRAHLEFVQRQRGIPALLFSDRLHQDDPLLKGEVRALMKAYAGRVAGLVVEGVEDGSLRADADAALLGQTVITMVQGLALRWSLFDYAFDLPSQADVVWTLLRPALAAKSSQRNKD